MAEVIKRFGFIPPETCYTRFPDSTNTIKARYADYQKAKWEQIRQALFAILVEAEYPSLSSMEVAQRLGCSANKIYRHFPDLSHSISARYLHYRKAHRLELAEQIHQKVRQAALELDARGMSLSSTNVGKLLTKPGIMLNKEAQSSLCKVRRELGYEKWVNKSLNLHKMWKKFHLNKKSYTSNSNIN